MDIERAVTASLLGDVEERDGGFIARCSFAPDFAGFGGHFPGRPICPAVAQVAAAVRVVERGLGRRLRLTGLSGAKFLLPIGPDTPVTLRCAPRPGAEGLAFDVRIAGDAGPVASFLLLLAEAASGPLRRTVNP